MNYKITRYYITDFLFFYIYSPHRAFSLYLFTHLSKHTHVSENIIFLCDKNSDLICETKNVSQIGYFQTFLYKLSLG